MDKDEAFEQRRDLHALAGLAFINLGSPYEDVALAAAQQLLELASGEATRGSFLATIDEDAAQAIKAAKDHESPEVRKANAKLIEWIDYRLTEIIRKPDVTGTDAAIDFFTHIKKMASNVLNRFEGRGGLHGSLEEMMKLWLPDSGNYQTTDWEIDLFEELKNVTARSPFEEIYLENNIGNFAFLNNPAIESAARSDSAKELKKATASATDDELLDIFRIVDVPKLFASAAEQDETIRRPVQALITTLAVRAAPFFAVNPEQAEADPSTVLEALSYVKAITEAEPGVPALNLRRAMIARRDAFTSGG